MRLEPGARVIVVGKGALFSGELVERRGKRRAWLVEKMDGTFQYVPIHATMYPWDRVDWGDLSKLFYGQEKLEKEWESVISRMKRI